MEPSPRSIATTAVSVSPVISAMLLLKATLFLLQTMTFHASLHGHPLAWCRLFSAQELCIQYRLICRVANGRLQGWRRNQLMLDILHMYLGCTHRTEVLQRWNALGQKERVKILPYGSMFLHCERLQCQQTRLKNHAQRNSPGSTTVCTRADWPGTEICGLRCRSEMYPTKEKSSH